jgi:hypothetical protein
MSRPALSRRADARWWWCRKYAGSSAPSPPLAYVIDDVALSGCNCVVAHDFTHTLHQRRPSRTFTRSERGGSAAASLRVLLYLGGGGRGDAKITKAGLRIAAPPKRDAEPALIRVRPG